MCNRCYEINSEPGKSKSVVLIVQVVDELIDLGRIEVINYPLVEHSLKRFAYSTNESDSL